MSDTLQALHEAHKERQAKFFPAPKSAAVLKIESERDRIAQEHAMLDLEIDRLELQKKHNRLKELREELLLGRSGIREIITLVCRTFKISKNEFLSQRRTPGLVLPRHIIFWLAKHTTRHSLTNIGRQVHRDHTSVMHGIERIEARRAADPEFAAELDAMVEILNAKAADAHVEP